MCMFSLLNDLQHHAQLLAGLCESPLLGVRSCLCVCFNNITKCEEHKQPSITGKHPMTSHINMISSIYTHTHNTVPLLDTPGLQAPGQTDAALTRADRVTVQTVVD